MADNPEKLREEEEETLAAIREGLASIARGEGEPLKEVARELRARFQIPINA